ncbi:MAG: sugar ABC transporter permease [Fimbriimonas sp.]|nr:sugar ABC transporter permease [Fimbriimonas sp.]
MRANRSRTIAALAFLAPNLVGFLVFTAGPVIFSLGASFTNWNLQQTVPTRVNGFANYSELLGDHYFWLFFVNTLYMMLGLPFALFGALWLAILLNRKVRGLGAYRTLLYLPSFASGVAIMILWKALYNPDFGPINETIRHLFTAVGVHADTPQWLQSTHNLAALDVEKVGLSTKQFGIGARDALILMGIWIAIGGNNMLLYLAALTNVPEELIEAAQLDGASPWKCFANVTWPQLAPTTFFILVMSIIGGLQGGFETARVMTSGGPAGTTTTLAYFIYSLAFEQFRIGYASAVAWVLFAFVFVATLINWRFGNRAAEF